MYSKILISIYLSISIYFFSFQDLLPRGCYHPIYYSVTYEDSWKCNFLGIFPDVHIPDHVTTSELHIQINITSKNEDDSKNNLEDFEIVFHTTATLPEKCKKFYTSRSLNYSLKKIITLNNIENKFLFQDSFFLSRYFVL